MRRKINHTDPFRWIHIYDVFSNTSVCMSVCPVLQHLHADLRHTAGCRWTGEVLQGYGQVYREVHTHTHTKYTLHFRALFCVYGYIDPGVHMFQHP